MVCYHPLDCWQPFYTLSDPEPDKAIRFSVPRANDDVWRTMQVCCSQCIGCRQQRAGAWAVRCMHEAQMYDDNSFLTLTYNDANLPPFGTLFYKDFQDFMKRFKSAVAYNFSAAAAARIRFYMCGEYGEKTGRPHYHALIFDFKWPDLEYWRTSGSGSKCYRSAFLESLWTAGNSEIGSFSYESAAYVARYCMKKVTGVAADDYYAVIDPLTGEYVGWRVPEFNRMSLKPGIGRAWYDKFKSDVFPHDYVVLHNGSQVPPPKYYSKLFELDFPVQMDEIRHNRYLRSQAFRDDNTPERLAVRKHVHQARLDRLVRVI